MKEPIDQHRDTAATGSGDPQNRQIPVPSNDLQIPKTTHNTDNQKDVKSIPSANEDIKEVESDGNLSLPEGK